MSGETPIEEKREALEEMLETLRKRLARDPGNEEIREEIGKISDELGHLAALSTKSLEADLRVSPSQYAEFKNLISAARNADGLGSAELVRLSAKLRMALK